MQNTSRPTLSGRFSLWVRQDQDFDYFAHQDYGNCLEAMPFYLLSFLDKEKIYLLTGGYSRLLTDLEKAQSMRAVNQLLIDYAQKLAAVVNAFLKARCNAIVKGINTRRQADNQKPITWADVREDILKGCLIKLLGHNDIDSEKQQALMDHLIKLNQGEFIDMHSKLAKTVQTLCAQEQSVKEKSAIRSSINDPVPRPDMEHPGRYYRLF